MTLRHQRRNTCMSATATIAALAVIATATTVPTAAHAQAPSPEAEAVGDWLIACAEPDAAGEDGDEDTGGARCELAQRVVDQAGQVQILLASVTAAPDAPPARISFTTPLGVWLEPGAVLVLPDSGGTRAIPFERCAPNGCTLILELDAELRAALEDGGLGQLRFADRLKQPLAAPVSFNGFAEGLERIETEIAPPAPPRRGLGALFGFGRNNDE